MAFYDAPLVLSTAQAITTSAASTLVYDVTGAGAGTAPALTWGNSTYFGSDIATEGVAQPCAYFTVTTTGTGTGTITFGVEAAKQTSGNNPDTYIRLVSSGAYVGTTLLAGNVIILPIPQFGQIAPAMGRPRFYRFYYDQTGNGAVSVTGFIGINLPTGYASTQVPKNFTAV